MKFKITTLASILVIAISSAFAPAFKATSYKVDVTKSSISWVGKKIGGGHNGSIALQSGILLLDGKKLTGGQFTVNMTSIKDAGGSAKLEGHLKADDFFGVDQFATSTFVIKKVTPLSEGKLTITGDLTIKGITNPVAFPADFKLSPDGSTAAAKATIVVDRTKYGIKYKSKSIFPDIGDKLIEDNFELEINLHAAK